MSDQRNRLRQTLAQLEAQLENADTLDPAVAERSRALVADIRRSLESGEPQPAQAASLTRRLGEAALEFEASHPTLAGTVGSVIDALGQMGI
jgi:Domain of unknown function (DUF4404)